MFDNLEALDALARCGTMAKAATTLRITQSAVSKRIAALEGDTRRALTQKQGRRVVLTPAGESLLLRASPLLAELRSVLVSTDAMPMRHVTIGISESILGSWGASLLAGLQSSLKDFTIEVHCHRGPAVIDRVLSGDYLLGIVAGDGFEKDLAHRILLREPMVLVRSARDSAIDKDSVITIEERSSTWEAISRRCAKAGIFPARRVESFFSVAQMAKAGLGSGLVPVGVALALGFTSRQVEHPGRARLTRPVSLIARKSVMKREDTEAVADYLVRSCAKTEVGWRSL